MPFIRTTAINKILRMKARKKVIQGGSSAGKTYGILPILIDKAIKNPGLEISVVGATVPHLKGGALKDFLKIMRETNRWVADNYNKSDRKYEFTNGSYIEFINADGDKAIGPRRDILYVNEANLISYETYSQLSIRTNLDIYIDFNPVMTFWAHTEVLTEDDAELLVLTYLDNEGLPGTVKSELEQRRKKAETSEYWSNWCRVYLDGQVGQLEGVIFNGYKTIDSIPEDAKLLGYGTDWGFTNDPTTCIGLYKWNNSIIAHEVIYQKGLQTGDYANLIKQNNIKETIYADSSEPRTIAEAKSYGVRIEKVKKPGIVESLHLMLEYPLIVTSTSTNLIYELDRYTWSDKNHNEPIDAFNHCIDALRYVVWMKLGIKERETKRPSFRSVRF